MDRAVRPLRSHFSAVFVAGFERKLAGLIDPLTVFRHNGFEEPLVVHLDVVRQPEHVQTLPRPHQLPSFNIPIPRPQPRRLHDARKPVLPRTKLLFVEIRFRCAHKGLKHWVRLSHAWFRLSWQNCAADMARIDVRQPRRTISLGECKRGVSGGALQYSL